MKVRVINGKEEIQWYYPFIGEEFEVINKPSNLIGKKYKVNIPLEKIHRMNYIHYMYYKSTGQTHGYICIEDCEAVK